MGRVQIRPAVNMKLNCETQTQAEPNWSYNCRGCRPNPEPECQLHSKLGTILKFLGALQVVG